MRRTPRSKIRVDYPAASVVGTIAVLLGPSLPTGRCPWRGSRSSRVQVQEQVVGQQAACGPPFEGLPQAIFAPEKLPTAGYAPPLANHLFLQIQVFAQFMA